MMAGWWRAIVGCLLVLAGIVLLLRMPFSPKSQSASGSAPAGLGTPIGTPLATPAPSVLSVRYFISGNPAGFHAHISYRTADGGTAQVPDYQGAWDKVLTMPVGQLVQITAQETQPGSIDQSITCEIQLNGTTWRRQTSQGQSASVTCQGELGAP